MHVEDDFIDEPTSTVVSMSLAGGLYTPIHTQITNLLQTYGIVTVVAAGNSASNACSFSPAAATSAMTVASSENDSSDTASDFSNLGPCCDIAAPGRNILSSTFTSTTSTGLKSGTSMATPLVSGVCALEMEQQLIDAPELVSAIGALTISRVKAMATQNRVDRSGDAWGALPLLFTSIGLTSVPQPPPPPPPPAPPQPNKAAPNMPLGRPATSDAISITLARMLGHPLATLCLLLLWLV